MLSTQETALIEVAGRQMLPVILSGANWLQHSRTRLTPRHLRRLGRLSISASVDVTPSLEVYLRVGFRAPGLSPMQASELLQAFLGARIPLTPNSEWQVEVDSQQWIHFSRRWVGETLAA